MPDSAKPGEKITVSINVLLNDQSYYILDEQVPDKWIITTTSKGSTEEKGHIKLVELNGQNSKIEYSVIAPQQPGKYTFSGTYLIDGSEQLVIIGNNEIIVE
jgi:hypothetical protein